MDNLRNCHIEAVKTVLWKAQVSLMYPSAYSPDLNPIEMMWFKVKSILRKMKARIVESLIVPIKQVMEQLASKDCLDWFRGIGYFANFLDHYNKIYMGKIYNFCF